MTDKKGLDAFKFLLCLTEKLLSTKLFQKLNCSLKTRNNFTKITLQKTLENIPK